MKKLVLLAVVFLAGVVVGSANANEVFDWKSLSSGELGVRLTDNITDEANNMVTSGYGKFDIFPIKAGNANLGFTLKGCLWKGETPPKPDDSESEFKGYRIVGGLGPKLIGKNWYFKGWIGGGYQEKSFSPSGGRTDEKSSTDLIGGGIDAGWKRIDKKWFPGTEVYGEILVPFNEKNDETEFLLELGLKEYIYKFSSKLCTFAEFVFAEEKPQDPKQRIAIGSKYERVTFSVGYVTSSHNKESITAGLTLDIW